jgi:hypothetical protein
MALLIDAPSFTANEVYEIQATDPVEGAATGASFSGLGLSNQPHQQLANRTAFLKQRQDTNIGNIAALQTFIALFRGLMAGNGYVQVPFADVNRGLITATLQWGSMFPSGGLDKDQTYSVTWPIQFPNACVWSMASLSNSTADVNAGKLLMETVGVTTVSGVFMSDFLSGASNASHTNDGFYWVSIGF